MAKYFTVMTGLRGCYMPDNAYVIKVKTRRELKAALEWEANDVREAGFVGANKKAVTGLAAHLWREAKKKWPSYLSDVVTYGYDRHSKPYAIQSSVATRQDYLDYCKEND